MDCPICHKAMQVNAQEKHKSFQTGQYTQRLFSEHQQCLSCGILAGPGHIVRKLIEGRCWTCTKRLKDVTT